MAVATCKMDKVLKVDGNLAALSKIPKDPNRQKLIEVVIGEIIDPAHFLMVFKSALEEIKPMEKILSEKAQKHHYPASYGPERVKGSLIAVKNPSDGMWFRGIMKDCYTIMDGEVRFDAFLIDHGLKLTGLNYPECARKLPDVFKTLEAFHFEFKLDGML